MSDPYATKPWLKSYDKHVPEKLTYTQDRLIPDLFRESVSKVKDKVAIYYAGTGTTFGQLDILSNKFARFLREQGLKQGDVVGVYLPNVLANYIAVMGIIKAGCVVTGLSALLSHKELEFQLNNSGAKALVAMDMLWGNVHPILGKTGVKIVAMVSMADFLPPMVKAPQHDILSVSCVSIHKFMDIMNNAPSAAPDVHIDPDSVCFIMYTGGTTGLPKGAMTTQQRVVNNITQTSTWLDIKPGEDTFLTAFPMFHIAGLFVALWSMSSGITQIAVPNPRDLPSLIESIKKYKPTLVGNVPTIFIELMKIPSFREHNFSHLKLCMSAAAPFPAENLKEIEAIVGKGKVCEGLGMTECNALVMIQPLHGKKKFGSVGLPLPDMEVKVVDPVTQQLVRQGEAGELIVKGPQVFKGYLNMPEETAHTLLDGWLYTGDIARMDEDGYFFMVDRLKDMVNVSGYKVFTRELDDLLSQHPAIAAVASVGIPNPDRPGAEIVTTAVVLKPGFEKSDDTRNTITDFVRQNASPYKVPKRIVFMDQLPTNAVGKILKRELREMMK